MAGGGDHDVGRGDRAPSGLTRTVVRGVGASGLGYVLTQVLTLAAYLALARLATPEDFGEFAAGAIVVNISLLVFGAESGILSALIHRRDRLEEAAATAVVATAVAGVVLSLLALAVSPLVGEFFDSDRIGSVAAASSGLMLLRTIPVVPMALLQRRFSFLRRMVVEPVGVVVFGVVAVIATANGMGVWGLVIATYAQAFLDAILSWGLVRWRPRFRLASIPMWRELVAYARHVFAASAVLRTGEQIPAALIGRFVGAAPLGQFRYGIRIASTPFGLILAAASYVLFPALARIADDRERFRLAFIRALRWMAVAGMPTGLIVLALGKPTAELVFGDVWADAGEAAMALCLYPAAGALSSVVVESFLASGRPQLVVRIEVVALVIGAATMVALLPLELVGVAAGVSIGISAGAVYALYKAHVVLSISAREILAEIGPPIAAAVVMGVSVLALDRLVVDSRDHETALGLCLLAAEGIAAFGIYGLVLHGLAPGRAPELRALIERARAQPAAERPADVDDLDLSRPL